MAEEGGKTNRSTRTAGLVLVLLLLAGLGAGSVNKSQNAFTPGSSSYRGDAVDGIQCRQSGCNGELCVRQDVAVDSTCEWQPSFACYSQEYTECVPISETECGWKQTDELKVCLRGAFENGDTGRVSSFEECVAAGNAVMESHPRKCRHLNQTFVEQI